MSLTSKGQGEGKSRTIESMKADAVGFHVLLRWIALDSRTVYLPFPVFKWILELCTLSERVKCFSVKVAQEQKTCGVFRGFFNCTREFKATRLFCLALFVAIRLSSCPWCNPSCPSTLYSIVYTTHEL